MLIAESTPFLQLQRHKAVLPASNEKEQMWIRNFSLWGWRNWSSLVSPVYHGKRRQDIRAGGNRAILLMGKCWQGFLLDSMFLSWLSWLSLLSWLLAPSSKLGISRALYNFKQPWIPASARVALPHGTHLPLGNGLAGATWKPAACFTAVNWGFPAKAMFHEATCSC